MKTEAKMKKVWKKTDRMYLEMELTLLVKNTDELEKELFKILKNVKKV